jgi:radical SAM superfamily enzyme YgiQ (UPF0313 family)
MRVLLLYPHAKKEIIGWGDLGAIAEPIALEYIGATARQEGHDVMLLDLRLHADQLDRTLLAFEPEVVGVTGYSMHVLRNLEVCARVKELVPNCVTVVGGHHATLEPVDFFEPQMDHVVVHEGTGPFRQLLRALAAGQPAHGIPGIWSRVNGEFRLGGPAPSFDIDSIPVPDRTLVPLDRQQYYIDWMKPIALMRTTVGCPFRCSFCSLWRIMDGRYYKRDVDRVIDELKNISERYVFFVDDEPFVNPQRMTELAEGIAEEGLDKEYFAYCRIDSILRDTDLMRRWHDVGLRRLLIGVETIFDHELKDYNKRQKRAEIEDGLRTAKKIGLGLFCNFIIHPNYTEKEFQEVIRFIRDNGVDYPSFTIWTPIPGTGNTYDAVIERQPNGRPNWDYFDLQHPVIKTRLPRQEFMHQFEDLYQIFAANYFASYSPLMLKAYQERSQELREPLIALARKVLSLSAKRPAPAGEPPALVEAPRS